MNESEYYQIQLSTSEEIYSNFEDLAGDNFYIRKSESICTFFDFETQSISWFVEIEELKFQFPKIDLKNTELVSGMTENFVFTILYFLGIQNEISSMN